MTAFIPIPNCAQLTAIYLCENQMVENVFHLQASSPWTSTLLAGVAADYAAWETAQGRNMRGTSVGLANTRVVDLTVADGVFDESTWTVNGTVASPLLPNNCSIAVKWLTAHRGRSFRGRTFHIGLTEGHMSSSDTNQVSTTTTNNLLTAYRALLTVAWHNSAQLVVASRRHNNAPRVTGITTQILDAGFTDNVIDSQRRRLPAHNVHR